MRALSDLLIATAMLAFALGAFAIAPEPPRCPPPSGRSVEALFAPCLAAAYEEEEPGPLAILVLPHPLQPAPALPRQEDLIARDRGADAPTTEGRAPR
jgi:hypothetical protein